MGQEFCKGCEDCRNFKDNEGNLAYFANKQMTNANNPFFVSGTDNSYLNKTELVNDLSFLTNQNNNLNNPNKNETLQMSLSNSKQINKDLSTNLMSNSKFYKNESEDIFKSKNNHNDNKENVNMHNSLINGKTNLRNKKNNNIYDNNQKEEEEVDQNKLNDIVRNYNSKIITKNFKKFVQNKNDGHKTLYTEYTTVNEPDYIQNNLQSELDVNLIPDKKYLYIGTKFNDKKDGLGLELFSDSQAKYFGRYINGKRVWACQYYINNDNFQYYYYGEIKGIYAYGYGWHENYKEKIYYEGMWKNSKKEGYGIEKYNKDNSLYKGQFSNGKKEGIGYFSWDDNFYMGEWSGGNLDGYGIYQFGDGSIYAGAFVNNRMEGLGEFTFPDIKTYFGYFEKDKRAGFGILIWYKENKVFIGFWANNKKNGLGKFISNGKIRYGLWENDELKQKIQNEESFVSQLKGQERNFIHFFKYNDFEDVRRKLKNILSL